MKNGWYGRRREASRTWRIGKEGRREARRGREKNCLKEG